MTSSSHPVRANKFGTSVAYNEAKMDMSDNDWEIMIGVGIEGKIQWRLIFIGRRPVLVINRYISEGHRPGDRSGTYSYSKNVSSFNFFQSSKIA